MPKSLSNTCLCDDIEILPSEEHTTSLRVLVICNQFGTSFSSSTWEVGIFVLLSLPADERDVYCRCGLCP